MKPIAVFLLLSSLTLLRMNTKITESMITDALRLGFHSNWLFLVQSRFPLSYFNLWCILFVIWLCVPAVHKTIQCWHGRFCVTIITVKLSISIGTDVTKTEREKKKAPFLFYVWNWLCDDAIFRLFSRIFRAKNMVFSSQWIEFDLITFILA